MHSEIHPEKEIFSLCDKVREISYAIHVYLGHGYLEKIYENALVHRLRKAGLSVEQQVSIGVSDEDGTHLGDHVVDILVEKSIIIELKSVKSISSEHVAQLIGYLKAMRIEHGLLINFGSYKFEMRKLAFSPSSNVPPYQSLSSLCSFAAK
ncbi:MAG: GxxExxY protein [Puniceicoccales bacterium]|jgi:GxxExxY protein|nr:GxxExxY protein [Puniceicoccales bacterium]